MSIKFEFFKKAQTKDVVTDEVEIIDQDSTKNEGSAETELINERAEDLDKSMMDGNTFFDEDESREGQSHYDEATGEAYNNSENMDKSSGEFATIHEISEKSTSLAENDFDKKTIKLLIEKYKDHPEILAEMGITLE